MKLFYSKNYCLAQHGFDTTRKATWIADNLVEHPIDGIELVQPDELDFEFLESIHTHPYVEAIATGTPRALAESQGFAWDPRLWEMVIATNSGVIQAARSAIQLGCAGSLSSGLHHARRGRGKGYCTFNGLILAACDELCRSNQEKQRILILDFDAHCGGGTVELIRDHGINRKIRHQDLSVDTYDAYEQSEWCQLAIVTDAEQYLHRVIEILRASENEPYQLCLYNAGVDPHERCEIGGLAGITADILRERDALVFSWCRQRNIPIAFVMAGGYTGPQLPQDELVQLHRNTLLEASRRG